MYDKEIEAFIEAQKNSAGPRRLEMLQKDLTGTKKLLGSHIAAGIKVI